MSTFPGWMPGAATRAALAGLQHRTCAALAANVKRHDSQAPAQWHITLACLPNRDAPAPPALASYPVTLRIDGAHLLAPGAYRSLASWPLLAGASQGA